MYFCACKQKVEVTDLDLHRNIIYYQFKQKMANTPSKGDNGFLTKRKNKVMRYLMKRNNVSLHTISVHFGLSQVRTISILEDIHLMKFKHLQILSVLFNTEVGLLVGMLYRGQTHLPPERIEEHFRNLDILEQEILKGDLI